MPEDTHQTLLSQTEKAILIPHTLFWSVQTNLEAADFAFNCQRSLIASACLYLIESAAVKSIPSSSTFFT